jgi:transposase
VLFRSESPKRNSKIARFGRSKEKRSDCPLVTLALIVDGHGFPKRSKIFEGNVSEPGTLWKILQELGESHRDNKKPKTVIIDAGIATEDNLRRLREDKRFEYVAISRKRKMEQDLFENATAKKLALSKNKELTVKMVKVGPECFLLCQSPDRMIKDQEIFNQRKQRFEKALKSLNDGLQKPRTKKGYASICERIGRLKERYKIGHFYKVEVEQEAGNATRIRFTFNQDKSAHLGQYVIRTSRADLGEEQLSLIHRTLTMIESAFRWLKSDLGMQPNYHQRDKRIESHIFISVLAYFVLAPILTKLEWGGAFVGHHNTRSPSSPDWSKPYGWRSVIGVMSSQVRITTSFTCKDGQRLDVRTTMDPTEEQRSLYQRLKMKRRPLPRVIFKHGRVKNPVRTVVPKKEDKAKTLN